MTSRARVFEALHRVSVGIAGMVDMGEVAKLTVEQAADLVGADGAILRWLAADGSALRLLAATGVKGWVLREDVPTDDMGDDFQRLRPTINNDYQCFDRAYAGAVKAGVRAVAVVPLSVSDRPAGALAVFSCAGTEFSETDIEILALLGTQVAPAIEAGRLDLELKQSLRSLQASELRFKTAFDTLTVANEALRASEARNAAVIEAAVDGLIVTDVAGMITTINPAAERIFGHLRAEVLGRDLISLIVPERYQAAHRQAHRRNLETGDRRYLDRRLEVVLQRADGSELSAEVSLSRFEVDGSISFSTSIRDLSDRDQLLASRERLAEVVNNAPVMLFAYDSDGVVTLAEGRATLSLLGVEPGAAIGLNAFDLVKHVPEAVAHLRRGLAGETFAGIIELPGLGMWVESRYSPILDADGKVLGMTGIATDITDRVKGAEAREESDAKSRLVAVVNHEVRTPLNSILGFAELLLNERAGTLNEKQRRYAGNVEAAGRHLLALVNDSLDLSRIAAGKMDMEIFDLELAPILDQAAGQIQPLVDSRGLEIRVDAGGHLWVKSDRRRLFQVLWNLLSNAIRHTPTGGVITIAARVTAAAVEISVSDTGIGIAADQRERIFEEYTQVEGQADGTGLGLPVSRRLAKLMGGDIKVESEVGVGSTFTMTLPRGHTSTR